MYNNREKKANIGKITALIKQTYRFIKPVHNLYIQNLTSASY